MSDDRAVEDDELSQPTVELVWSWSAERCAEVKGELSRKRSGPGITVAEFCVLRAINARESRDRMESAARRERSRRGAG